MRNEISLRRSITILFLFILLAVQIDIVKYIYPKYIVNFNIVIAINYICLVMLGFTIFRVKYRFIRHYQILILVMFCIGILINSKIDGYFERTWFSKILNLPMFLILLFNIVNVDGIESEKNCFIELIKSKYLTIMLLISCVLIMNREGIKIFIQINQAKTISAQTCITGHEVKGPLGYTTLSFNVIHNDEIESKICGNTRVYKNGVEVPSWQRFHLEYINPQDEIKVIIEPDKGLLDKTSWIIDDTPYTVIIEQRPLGISDFTNEVNEQIDELQNRAIEELNAYDFDKNDPGELVDILLYHEEVYGNVYMTFIYKKDSMLCGISLLNPYIDSTNIINYSRILWNKYPFKLSIKDIADEQGWKGIISYYKHNYAKNNFQFKPFEQ